jgi:CAAX prenyl protease-like protein
MDWSWAILGQGVYNPWRWCERWGTTRGRAVVWRSGGAQRWRNSSGGPFFSGFSSAFFRQKDQRHPRFTSIPTWTFTPISFVVTVVLFGSEHTLWLAGLMAGVIYNLLLYKTRRLWPCVLAHGVTNLLLGVHVLGTQEWQWW